MSSVLEFPYAIRDVIHGFVRFNEWEKSVINHPWFQRLRRIRQLALTDYVYPGATHSRFEHSLGVMHLASQMFDRLLDKCKADLLEYFEMKGGVQRTGHKFEAESRRARQVLRFAALLHDIGHGPFSHASGELLPSVKGKQLQHEDYSIAIISQLLDLIENTKEPQPWPENIKTFEISSLLEKTPDSGQALGANAVLASSRNPFWWLCKRILDSQLDADKLDYLLRDSYYCGVQYGRFDLARVIEALNFTVERVPLSEENTAQFKLDLAIDSDSYHVAESIPVARYWMYTEVYHHKTRRIMDLLLSHALRHLLTKGTFAVPSSKKALQQYLDYDDYWVCRQLIEIKEHQLLPLAKALKQREHPRLLKRELLEAELPPDKDEDEKHLEVRARVFADLLSNAGFKVELLDPELLTPQVWIDTGARFNPYKFSFAHQINLRDTSLPSRGSRKWETRFSPMVLSKKSQILRSFSQPAVEPRVYVILKDQDRLECWLERRRR